MQQTSLNAYYEDFLSFFRSETKIKILQLLKRCKNGMTDREIAMTLGYNDPNKIRPRRNELVKEGLVVPKEIGVCSVSKKKSIKWRSYSI